MFNKIRLKANWRNLDPVWRWNTRHARKLHEGVTDWVGARKAANMLKKYGIATTKYEEFEKAVPFAELLEYKGSLTPAGVNRLKPYLIEWWKNEVLDLNNPFVKLALSKYVLQIVSDYLGCWPRLYDYRLWETKVIKPEERKIYSQMWHRDPEDKKLLNMFIYLNDVLDEGTGPFHYVPGSHSEGPHWKTLPQILPPKASYPGDGNVERAFKDNILVALAPAGTVIFADTAGLHKGGFSTEKPRLMFKALYTSAGNFYNNKTRYETPDIFMGLTDQQYYAIGLL